MNNLMRRLRISKLPLEVYRKVATVTKFSESSESEITPVDHVAWRRLIVRFNLNRKFSFHDWVIILHYLENHLISTPYDLMQLEFGAVRDIFSDDINSDMIAKLCQESPISLNSNKVAMSNALNLATNAGLLAQSLRHKDINNTLVAGKFHKVGNSSSLPDSFSAEGNAAKIRCPAQSDLSESSISSLLDAGVSINIIRQLEDSLPSVASVIQRYSAFCDLMRYPYCPPVSARGEAMGSLFNPGETFQLCSVHLVKACAMLDLDYSR